MSNIPPARGTIALAALGLLSLPACAPTYDYRFLYDPHPADFEIDVPPESAVQLIAVLPPGGKSEGKEGQAALRLSIADGVDRQVKLKPGSLALFAVLPGKAHEVPGPAAVPGLPAPSLPDMSGAITPAAWKKEITVVGAGDSRGAGASPIAPWNLELVETPPTKRVMGLASVLGIRPPRDGAPPSVDVRLWLENTTDGPIRISPSSLSLRAANLREFPKPVTAPGSPIQLKPGQQATLAATFPFPGPGYPGEFDLNGLDLRWKVELGERTVIGSVSFSRTLFHLGSRLELYEEGAPDGVKYGAPETTSR